MQSEDHKTVEYKSRKSQSVYTVTGTPSRAYLAVSGEASTNQKVLKLVDEVRKNKTDFATAEWEARMLSNTY